MKDKEIEKLIDKLDNTITFWTKEKIIERSKGNPKLTVLMMGIKNRNLEIMDNNKNILFSHYKVKLREMDLSEEEKKTLLLLSFKRHIILGDSNTINELCSFFGLDNNNFEKTVKNLAEKHICNIFNGKLVTNSDQNFSDFLILYFIGEKNEIKIEDFLSKLYPIYSKEIIKIINLINRFNCSEDWEKHLKEAINYAYDKANTDEQMVDFLCRFAIIIPDAAISYLNCKIFETKYKKHNIPDQQFYTSRNSNQITDPIIKMLISLFNGDGKEEALSLLMNYINKEQDKVFEAIDAINASFTITGGNVDRISHRFKMIS